MMKTETETISTTTRAKGRRRSSRRPTSLACLAEEGAKTKALWSLPPTTMTPLLLLLLLLVMLLLPSASRRRDPLLEPARLS